MSRHKWYDVIVAWAEGKTIQYNYEDHGWRDFVRLYENASPGFNSADTKWRIKPETKKYRVGVMEEFDMQYTVVVDTELEEKCRQEDEDFVKWITPWIEYEV